MTQELAIKQLAAEVNYLKREVKQLRLEVRRKSRVDPEGEYRPEFVKEVLKASKEPSTKRFNPDTFLAEIKQA